MFRDFETHSFYSVGFNKGKGLKHLIAATGTDWKPLHVSPYENENLLTSSAPSKWWNNPVSPLNTANINSGNGSPRLSLSNKNTIYAITENVSSRGIDITGNGIALVTLPGRTLSPTATISAVDCRPGGPIGTQNCFICNKHNHFF